MKPASAVLCLSALGACGRGGGEPARPSVVLVSIDTLRADHLGLYGYERDTSPFLDRWAQGATVFERAYTPCSWTLVAHMSMLTGLHSQQHGVIDEELALSPEIPLVAERLKRAGYRTLGLYFQGWIHARHGFDRGFDVFRPHQSAEEAGAHLAELLDELDSGRPFFLFLHLFDVHSGPFRPGRSVVYPSPEPFQDLFLPGASGLLPQIPEEELWESEHLLDERQMRALVALYDGGIRHVDTRLGEWFTELEDRGLLSNALVIVTADHGEALMQRGRVSGHGGFWEEGLHVPLLVRHPRALKAGERVSEPVHHADIVPTILDVVGLAADPALPGRSLLGQLDPEHVLTGSRPAREYVLRWPYKIVRNRRGNYFGCNLAEDPLEQRPVFAREQDFQQWRAQALGTELRYPAPLSIGALPESDRDALRQIGYAGESESDEEDEGQ